MVTQLLSAANNDKSKVETYVQRQLIFILVHGVFVTWLPFDALVNKEAEKVAKSIYDKPMQRATGRKDTWKSEK